MFAIELFCGHKHGGWHKTADRFPDEAKAKRTATADAIAELRCSITPFARRVVPVGLYGLAA